MLAALANAQSDIDERQSIKHENSASINAVKVRIAVMLGAARNRPNPMESALCNSIRFGIAPHCFKFSAVIT